MTGCLSPCAITDLAGDAAMVVSELVTNAIRAGASSIVLEVGRVGGMFRITVIDDAAGVPKLAEPDPTAVAGRGLRIVDALSARWGVEEAAVGKRVWAELDLTRTSTESDHRETGGVAGQTGQPADDRMATG
jgi:anti-sigma regulatory factor (Ser/Thr protein kinase)